MDDHEEIAKIAFKIWEQKGRPQEQDFHIWLLAKAKWDQIKFWRSINIRTFMAVDKE